MVTLATDVCSNPAAAGLSTQSRPYSILRLMAIVLVAPLALRAADETVFTADFSGTKPLEQDGWEQVTTPAQSHYEAREGVLRVTCRQNPHHDGFIRRRIPIVKRGSLEFDANIAMEQAGNKLGVALTVSIYNIGTWFHDYCKDWRRYFPGGPNQRLPGFSTEPVGHQRLTPVKLGEWSHYRILFDHDAGTVEYYCNDMRDPVHIDYDVPILGREEYEGGTLRIGSMGLTKGPVVYGIRNVVLKQTTPDSESNSPRETVLLFHGMSSDQYNLGGLFTETVAAGKTRVYTVRTHGAAIAPRNQLKVDRLPSAATVAKASAIVLVDMPLSPGECLPPPLLRQLIDAVHNGARLVIVGGMFSLGKGGHSESALNPLLPIEVDSPWGVTRFPEPRPLCSEAGPLGVALEAPHVLWYHSVNVKEGATVGMTADGKPMFVSWPIGEGSVSVSLPCPAGNVWSKGTPAFWRTTTWRQWLESKILEGR
ncbi:MAG: hypothetical protein HN406_07180 [Lentisphaerae bacterium]|nr:hypothetical protein [Lentisphaerota bacterium]